MVPPLWTPSVYSGRWSVVVPPIWSMLLNDKHPRPFKQFKSQVSTSKVYHWCFNFEELLLVNLSSLFSQIDCLKHERSLMKDTFHSSFIVFLSCSRQSYFTSYRCTTKWIIGLWGQAVGLHASIITWCRIYKYSSSCFCASRHSKDWLHRE